MPKPRHTSFIRRCATQTAAAAVLLSPGVALAAGGPERGLIAAGPQPDLLSPKAVLVTEQAEADTERPTRATPIKKSALLEADAERKQARDRQNDRQQKLVHPVTGRVDYGDVIAAFGHARGRPHQGQDIFAPAGTPLRAPAAGKVIDAGTDGGRGNWVAIYDADRKRTYSYFHLVAPTTVSPGENVKRGQKLGEVGCTGSCSGDHLHFEIREGKGPYGTAIDPMPMLERTVRKG